MLDFSTVKAITIPEGAVKKITAGGVVLWQKEQEGSVLPEGYVQLEYIESTGTQYINTGYVPVENTAIDVGYEFTSIPSNTNYYYVFGDFKEGGIITTRLMTSIGYNDICVNAYTNPATDNGNITIKGAKEAGVRYDDVLTHTTYTSNGTTYVNSKPTISSSNTRKLALFANHCLSGKRISDLKLYYCRIKEGNTLVRNFIPCLDADGVACLYDAVTQQTYYNAGTGEFEYGEAV